MSDYKDYQRVFFKRSDRRLIHPLPYYCLVNRARSRRAESIQAENERFDFVMSFRLSKLAAYILVGILCRCRKKTEYCIVINRRSRCDTWRFGKNAALEKAPHGLWHYIREWFCSHTRLLSLSFFHLDRKIPPQH